MERQEAFRGRTKIVPSMKGSSQLNIAEFSKYDTREYEDQLAKCSKKVTRSNIADIMYGAKGDGDVWVEKLLTSTKTRQTKVFFVSKQTGRKVAGEPNSGAGRVFYLKPEYKRMILAGKLRPAPKKKKKMSASPASVVTNRMMNLTTSSDNRPDRIDATGGCACSHDTYRRPRVEGSGQGAQFIRPGLERSGSGTRNILAEFLEVDDND